MNVDELLRPVFLIPIAGGAVILLGIAIAVFKMMSSKKSAAALQQWTHAAYSLWTGGEDSGAWPRERAASSLSSWYGATGPGPFWNVIRGLRSGQTGNPAWDRVRALDLLRIARAAEYIDDEQCWTEAGAIATELQRLYSGWEQLAYAFEVGMRAWQEGRGITDPAEVGRVQRSLPLLRQQIWPRIPYSAQLVSDD